MKISYIISALLITSSLVLPENAFARKHIRAEGDESRNVVLNRAHKKHASKRRHAPTLSKKEAAKNKRLLARARKIAKAEEKAQARIAKKNTRRNQTRLKIQPPADKTSTAPKGRRAEQITKISKRPTTPDTAKLAEAVKDLRKARKNLEAVQKAEAKEPTSYKISMRQAPETVKDFLQFMGATPSKKPITATPLELRNGLNTLAAIERKIPGTTQKLREYAESRGYNGGAENVTLKGNDLTRFIIDFLEDIPNAPYIKNFLVNELGLDFDPNEEISLPQYKITKYLGKVQTFENKLKGMTQEVRTFLRSHCGFKG